MPSLLEYYKKGFIVRSKDRIIKVDILINETYQKLEKLSYSKGSLKKFKYSFQLFQEYTLKNEVTFYTQKLALSFLEEYCEIFSNSKKKSYRYQERKRAISKLDEMYKYGIISSKKFLSRRIYQFYGCLEVSIKEYLSYKSKTLSEARIKSIKLYLERFSLYISNISEIKTLNDLDIKHINTFIKSCSVYTHNTCYATITCLRQYIIYLENSKLLDYMLSASIPKIAKRRNRTYAHAFTKQETEALLQSIGCNNSKERRDYAMLLLAARLGLRSSDIVNLKLSNINWEKSEISLVQQKTKKPLTLPLLNDVGEAIINYIKNGRPNVQDSHIFIRENKPYTCISSGSLFTIVDQYLKRANIKVPANHRHGPHALRHSLATLLLEDNIPISTIKEILAHKSVETTKIYLKIAEKQLLKCALDVPAIATNGAS